MSNIKKVLILSDTHMPKRAKEYPHEVLQALITVDLVIHLGDFNSFDSYQWLKDQIPLQAVYGNVDDASLQACLPFKKIVEIEGVKVGLTHGHGKGKTTEKRVLDAFLGERVDLILFGHSHIPLKKKLNGVIMFNPGSPTDKRRQAQYSFGILEVDQEIFSVEHHFFD